MADENDNLQLPPAPPNRLWATLTTAGLGAALGALIGGLFARIGGEKGADFWRSVVTTTVDVGFIGGLVGWIHSSRDKQEYPLKVENAVLHHQVEQLKTDKSFAQEVAQQRVKTKDDDCGKCNLRG